MRLISTLHVGKIRPVLTQIGDFVGDVENGFLRIQLLIRFQAFDKRKDGREVGLNSFLRLLGQLLAWQKKLDLDSSQWCGIERTKFPV
jgi:hypothetical protein